MVFSVLQIFMKNNEVLLTLKHVTTLSFVFF